MLSYIEGGEMPMPTDLLGGTLDLLILQTFTLEPMQGWGAAQRIQRVSRDVLQIGQGSLYPALYRLEHKGWIPSDWGNSEKQSTGELLSVDGCGQKPTGDGFRNLGSVISCDALVLGRVAEVAS
jgi:PadR family transcriptional regulator, regulatory protein PadR